ncbi:MAG: LemA family protein [Bacteroidetes bacterium]|nr:LemA family protein [Bacteroidota bacterium]
MIYLLVLVAFLALISLILYNSLIRKKNDVENAFASVDVMLKKRYDLIPALVDAVKGYMNYEKDLLKEITELRARALSDNLTGEERVKIENKIRKNLADILVAVENYPDLKANQNFLKLQGAINETEEQLAASRRAFNAAVTVFNNAVEVFPSNVMASLMKYERKTLFDIPESEKVKPDISPLSLKRLIE